MSSDGGNDTLRGRVICPYYQHHSAQKRAIVCEGLSLGMETAMVFNTRAEMERYSARFCETFRYGSCPLARGLALKHVEQEQKAGRY